MNIIKKFIYVFIFYIILYPSLSNAINFKTATFFVSGFVSGLVCHELSHYLVAKSFNIDDISFKISLKGMDWDNHSDQNKLKYVAIAGFTEQIMSSEIILYSKTKNPFWFGYLTFNIIQPVICTSKFIIDKPSHFENDMACAHHYGLNKNYIGIVINIHSLFTLYRLHY